MAKDSGEEKRKHLRFSDRALYGTKVSLSPCPPLYGETASGYMVNLSAGGMGIVMPDLIPKNVFLKMKLKLPDGLVVESVVKVRRIVKYGRAGEYLHGVEFLNPAPEIIEKIDGMARDVVDCDKRIEAHAPEICVAGCFYYSTCRRPQRREINNGPEPVIQFESEPQDVWSKFKAKFASKFKNND